MKIFLINLDRRPDRLQFVASQLNNLQLDFERISAIDGEKINIETLNDIKINNNRHYIERSRLLSMGEIGCALSHRLIWKRMLEQNLDYALILEDDVTIDAKLLDILTDKTIRNYDFINLLYMYKDSYTYYNPASQQLPVNFLTEFFPDLYHILSDSEF